MSPLPDGYPSPRHLPFNRHSLNPCFELALSKSDPGGEGFWALLRGTELLVCAGPEGLCLPSGPFPETLATTGRKPVFIGTWEGRPCRALRVPGQQELPAGMIAENLLASQPQVSLAQLSLEWGKKCCSCGYCHYPHIHPCVIVLVRRPGQVLLTRKAEWPEGRYSLVAGFLDFGECLEEAVEREVLEETGVTIENVRYIGSQSWPFPSQLMMGFVADYVSGEVQVEEKELEDARWFDLDDLPRLPPKRSIARYILDNFLRQEPEARRQEPGARG